MSYRIFLTGSISIPEGAEIPEKFKWCITGKPHSLLLNGDNKYDVYYIAASVSTCSGDEESLKHHFIEVAKELNAISFTGVTANDRNSTSKNFIHWDRDHSQDKEK